MTSNYSYMPADLLIPKLDRRYFAYTTTLVHLLDALTVDPRLIQPERCTRSVCLLSEIYPPVTYLPDYRHLVWWSRSAGAIVFAPVSPQAVSAAAVQWLV